MKIIKLCLLFISLHFFSLHGDEDTSTNSKVESTIKNSPAETKEVSKNTVQTKIDTKKDAELKKTDKNIKPIPDLKKTLFMNSRVNNIILVISDHKNKQFQIPLKMGHQHEYYYNYPPLKVICHEKLTPKTALAKTDLETHTAFVFNDQQKTDKYHFITIHQKDLALEQARQAKNVDLFNEISERTIYNI